MAQTQTPWVIGDLFYKKYEHSGSLEVLWEKTWKFPCSRGLYPFHDGAFEDFEPIILRLIEKDINDAYSDAYTQEFLSTAEALTEKALAAQGSDRQKAIELFKRAACVYRISRFPFIKAGVKAKAFENQKAVYLRGASLWDVPLKEVVIPHTLAEKDDLKAIPLYLRTPSAAKKGPVPTVLLMTGLDGHRPDNSARTDDFIKRGWACVVADIPGVADCPADRRDPSSPDRMWTVVLDWMAEQGTYDMRKVCAWGLSAGGYYAIRAAHTHKERLAGCVGHGAGTHHYIGREWLDRVDDHEYPFKLTTALVEKYGYESVEELKEKAQKTFSLVDTGIVNMPSTRLLLVNGTHDGLMPIEDSMLLMEYGSPKEARFYSKLLHMGYPPANTSVFPWLEEIMGVSAS